MATPVRPKVTAVIPAYNAAATLREAVRSVLKQSEVAVQTIVVDDGSSDETATIAESFGPAVEVVRMRHSGLPGVCRNAGIRLARGDYVAFLDADDEWFPDKLRIQCGLMDGDRRLGLVCSNAIRRFGEAGASDRLYFPNGRPLRGSVLYDMIRENPVITSTALVRLSALMLVGVFREDDSVPTVEDYDLWLRLAVHYDVASLPDALATYRDHPGSYRSTVSELTELAALGSIMVRLREELPKNTREGQAVSDRIAGLSAHALGILEGLGSWRCAVLHSCRLLRERPLELNAWRSVGGFLKRSTFAHGHHHC